MPLKLGSTTVSTLRLGTATPSKVMLGTSQVWPVAPANDPDAQAWIDLVAVQDGQPLEAGVQAAAHKMFAAIKAAIPNAKNTVRLINFVGPRRINTMRFGLFTLVDQGTFANVTDANIDTRWRGIKISTGDQRMALTNVTRTYARDSMVPGGAVFMFMQQITGTSGPYVKPYGYPWRPAGSMWGTELGLGLNEQIFYGAHRWVETPGTVIADPPPNMAVPSPADGCYGFALSTGPPYTGKFVKGQTVQAESTRATTPTIADSNMGDQLNLFGTSGTETCLGTYSSFALINEVASDAQITALCQALAVFRSDVAAALNP
jgi:hypothetical protein